MNGWLSKKVRVALCFLPLALPVSLFFGPAYGGAWFGLPLVILFVIVPILDFLFEKDTVGLQLHDFSKTELILMRSVPHLFIVCYAFMLTLYFRIAPQLSTLEYILALVAMGAVGSINITASHELIHKHDRVAKLFARFGLSLVGYLHFEYSHLYGHHREAATTSDNHTAWLDEGFFSFLLRTEKDAAAFCAGFEKSRLKRIGRSGDLLANRIYSFIFIPLIYLIGISLLFGKAACLLWIGQALIAIYSLEAVAYIEHYGLLRNNDGMRFEPMSYQHSWDSYHKFSNHITFMLQRHGDHHMFPAKDYFLLKANNFSPELPAGYPLLILSVGSPKLWRRLIRNARGRNRVVSSPSSRRLSYR